MDLCVDGNALGGLLIDVFGADLTAASAVCGSCGTSAPVAVLTVYRRAPGTVVRCRSCDAVLMVFVTVNGALGVELAGLAGLDSPGPLDVLRRCVGSFNAGVRTGDFSAMTGMFTDDGEMAFRAIPAGSFRGKAAIAGAYAQQPPDDTIRLLRCDCRDSSASADYAWSKNPGALAGRMDLAFEGTLIRRLTITYLRD
jgi:Family of unknown function (DUF6510)